MHSGHNNRTNNYNRSFAIGITLNVVFVVIEATYGVTAGSLALIADAGHNLSDVLSLLLAWGAYLLSTKTATQKRTYGFRKATVMASLISAIMLFFALGSIAWETVNRFLDPKPIDGTTIIFVALVGVVINTLTALLFMSGQKHDLNIRGAFLHMAADAGVSLGVVIAGIIIAATGWFIVDPIISLVIVVVILVGTWSLFRESIDLSIDSVPRKIDLEEVRNYLIAVKNVSQIHDLHVWPLSTTEVALSVHMIIDEETLENDFLAKIQHDLHAHFGIEHSTIQIERKNDVPCILNKNNCI